MSATAADGKCLFNLNKSQPGFVPAKYIEMVLEVTEKHLGRSVTSKTGVTGQPG